MVQNALYFKLLVVANCENRLAWRRGRVSSEGLQQGDVKHGVKPCQRIW